MKIRLARDEDFASIARLRRQTIRNINAKDYSEDIIRVWSGSRGSAQGFRNSAHKCKRWVAVDDGKVVGFCDHGFKCELWGLYVHKDYIGKGVGSRLLKTAEESMKKQGCDVVKLKSTITAKEFYLKNGYSIVRKTLHKIADVKVLAYIMAKKTK